MSWPTFDNYSSNAPLNLQDPKTVTNRDDWREIKCPTEIELMLKLRNQKRFGQAEGTTFTKEPLQSHFNWSASTHQAELVLHSNYTNCDIDHISQDLLASFTRVTDLDNLPAKVTKEETCQEKFRKWRESTSTSPSRRHLGHYKNPYSLPLIIGVFQS